MLPVWPVRALWEGAAALYPISWAVSLIFVRRLSLTPSLSASAFETVTVLTPIFLAMSTIRTIFGMNVSPRLNPDKQ